MKNLPANRVRVRREGSRDCWRTRNVAASCGVCAARPEVVHVSLATKGFRCSEHCEDCTLAASKPGETSERNKEAQ